MSKGTSSSSGPGFLTLLAVLFIGLKLTGYVTWSWWIVLSPIWAGWAVLLAVVGVVAWFVRDDIGELRRGLRR